MKKLNVFALAAASILAIGGLTQLASCGGADNDNETAKICADAGTLSTADLVEKAKAEMVKGETFRVIGLSSVLKDAIATFATKYDFINTDGDNKNIEFKSYKDAELFPALTAAEKNFFADYALTQDIRSINSSLQDKLLHNYVPKDYAELGLAKEDTYPLKTLYFNKVFYHHAADTKEFNNVWQLACEPDNLKRIEHLSFQDPTNEKINMSFLLSIMNPKNEKLLKDAYKEFYGKDYAGEDKIGYAFVKGFIKNVSVWHPSDTDCMKKTLPTETTQHNVYFGAFAKMKGVPDLNKDNIRDYELINWKFDCKGFKGFTYAMYGSIVNNAKHPYTAALFAREMLTADMYKAMCFKNDSIDKKVEDAGNVRFGYYSPCINKDIPLNKNDWTITEWNKHSLVEDMEYLTKPERANEITNIKALCAESTADRPTKD